MLRPIALAVLVAATATATADEVVLNDGSRLQGTVVRLDADGLVFATAFVGELTIDRIAIRTLRTDETAVVQLATGDRLVGRLGVAGDAQVVASDTLGTVPLPDGGISAVWRKGDESPSQEKARVEREALQARIEEESMDWSGSVSAGFRGTSGTKDRVASNARAEAEMRGIDNLLALFIDARLAEENSQSTENEIRAGARLEHDISDAFFTFGEIELERDKVEELDLRTTLSGGLGYQFIDRPGNSLKGRAGVGFEQEAFEGDESNSELILSLGYTWKLKVGERVDFVHELDILPAVSDPTGDYRVNSRAQLDMPLGDERPWSLKLGLRNQYDAEPQPGVEELETTYFINLGYDFN